MIKTIYAESSYRFTDPIRYFKANDPIYFEVENIPLKQLQENDNWIKDQITKGVKIEDMGRSGFSELKPYSEGVDNLVRVKAGRFTARINDAYSITPLQKVRNLLGQETNEYNVWAALGNNSPLLDTLLRKFYDFVEADSLNLNGLIERVFTWPAMRPRRTSPATNTAILSSGLIFATGKPPFPSGDGAMLFPGDTQVTEYVIKQYEDGDIQTGFATLGIAEAVFVKRWRGVARTAVVDLAEEATIEVKPFDPEDFFYIDSNGVTQIISGANQRIDLLFIYSKPIDTDSIAIAKFNNFSTPTVITKPALGIVYGAGLGIDLTRTTNDIGSSVRPATLSTETGVSKMLAMVSDSLNSDNGFSKLNIHGSFPAPDDLMNLVPQLDSDLPEDHLALVGQTVLPIAYIVVKANAAASLSNSNIPVITNDDIVDIRPFFRTTELSYNERSGLAAAVPAPSIANPVVTQAELAYEINRSYRNIQSRLNFLENTGSTESKPRVVSAGYIKGGFNFGVEGAIARYIETRLRSGGGSGTKQLLKAEVISRFGLPAGFEIPDFPDWDMAPWVATNSLADPGTYPNDYINVFQSGGSTASRSQFEGVGIEFSPFSDNGLVTRLSNLGTDNILGSTGHACVYFVKKKIFFNKSNIPWMFDYHVDVQLWNCAPLSCRASTDRAFNSAGTNSIWVEKGSNYFTIYVAWVANDYYFGNGKQEVIPNINNSTSINMPLIRNGKWLSGFIVMTDAIVKSGFSPTYSQAVFNGESNAGIAIYPSVTFKMTAYPGNYPGLNLNLNSESATVTLA